MTDTEHRGTASRSTATTTAEADMKRGRDLAATAEHRHLDKPGRLHIGHLQRVVCHLVGATVQQATVPRSHDDADGADVARETSKTPSASGRRRGRRHHRFVAQPRDHRPGPALRVAGLGGHLNPERSPTGRCQRDAIVLRVALEVSACVRS
jgi:hypothetical protein